MLDATIATTIAAAGSPILQACAVVLGTFILEDATTILAAMLVAEGRISAGLAIGALYVGIVLGDLGLYCLGWLAARIPAIARRLPPQRTEVVRAWLAGRVFRVVLVSRFLPGVRLPAYTTCGYLGADIKQFLLSTMLATSLWTTMLFAMSLHLGVALMAYVGPWRWAGVAGLVLGLFVIGRLANRLQGARS